MVGLQSELEAKLRELKRFRENMTVLGGPRTRDGRQRQRDALNQLTEQISGMLGTKSDRPRDAAGT